MATDEKNVNVYLSFKEINNDSYINSVRISHWQVICHFKNTNRYKSYELQTDYGDKGGAIFYQISDFSFTGDIYYYYVGQCDASETDLQLMCDAIHINNDQYVFGFKDCQTWAKLLIESLGFHFQKAIPFQVRFNPFYHVLRNIPVVETLVKILDIGSQVDPILNDIMCPAKYCRGYKNLNSE